MDLDQGWSPTVDNTAVDHDKGPVQSREEGAAAPGEIRAGGGAEGRRGKEEERGKDPLPSPSLHLHPLPAHLNPHQLFETLQEAAVVQRRDPELLVEDACLKSFCTCCMKLDVPPQSFLIYEGRWCSSPPRLTGKSRRETGRGTDFFFFESTAFQELQDFPSRLWAPFCLPSQDTLTPPPWVMQKQISGVTNSRNIRTLLM